MAVDVTRRMSPCAAARHTHCRRPANRAGAYDPRDRVALDRIRFMPSEREQRLARNEAAFRELNDSLDTSVHQRLADSHTGLPGFVCECADPGCAEIVHLGLQRYEEIRSDPRTFLISPGHVFPEVEDVISREDGFLVVRKHADVANIVRATDPRA